MSDIVESGSEQIVSDDEVSVEGPSFQDEAGAARGEREGLPRNYRMRADRHYVEQLVTRAAGQPVRMLPITDIEPGEPFREIDLRPLLESIRTHGIVQPLLVRRQGSRYAIIAGRRRRAAAHLLRLSTVPCLIHDVDEAQADALSAADNLTVSVAPRPDRADVAAGVRQVVAHHLHTIRICTDLVSAGMPTTARSVFDLIKAHSWRAARLIDALDLITNVPPPPGRDRRLSTIVDEVVDGFSAESRLNDFAIRAQIADETSSSGLNDRELLAGVSAALLAMLPAIEAMPHASILVRVAASDSASVVIEVSQSAVPVPIELSHRFFDEDAVALRPGGWSAAAGALAVRALADRYRGSARLDVAAHVGSSLHIELIRRS
ncbi:MAG: ParB/RepB/Spo0J family partition protein [Betaproteobacteria bacterium]